MKISTLKESRFQARLLLPKITFDMFAVGPTSLLELGRLSELLGTRSFVLAPDFMSKQIVFSGLLDFCSDIFFDANPDFGNQQNCKTFS